MISAQAVSFRVGGRDLVKDVDLDLVPGRLTVVIGPNGAGKSTLFRLLTGEMTPTSGQIIVNGRDVKRLSAFEMARMRAVVPQHTVLAFPFSVAEVVELGMTVPGLIPAGRRARALTLSMLGRVGLRTLADRAYTTLSGGERQRVHIARALAQLEASDRIANDRIPDGAASTLFVDEPTSSLDIAHQLLVLDELRREASNGRAVLAVLHDLNLAAANADEIVLLSDGHQAARGRPADVLTDELLSVAYGCEIRLNATPRPGVPFLLPQSCGLAAPAAPVARRANG
ncbi:MAG: heme ABC transporter ATP-binding protein [Hyphomicrobiaceae bacterium]